MSSRSLCREPSTMGAIAFRLSSRARLTRPMFATTPHYSDRLLGFTLIEVMVAITILALMSAIMFAGFRLAMTGYVESQKRIDVKARKRVLEDMVRRQIGSLFPLRPTAAFLESESAVGLDRATEGNIDPTALALSQIPLFYGTDESMTFITVAPLRLIANPGLTVVRYGLAEDEYGVRYFGAMESRFDGLPSFQEMVDIPKGKPIPVIEEVQDLHFEYYGYDPDSQTYDWFEEWRGDATQSVPSAIRIYYDDEYLVATVNATFFGSISGRDALRNLIRR